MRFYRAIAFFATILIKILAHPPAVHIAPSIGKHHLTVGGWASHDRT
jgi:hypothetical protein